MKFIYEQFLKQSKEGRKSLAVLIDPDKTSAEKCMAMAEEAVKCNVDYIFVGSSILTKNKIHDCVRTLKNSCNIPVILFPGNVMQISDEADGILFLSLISGRNPDLLIGNHVLSAPFIRSSGMEVIPTGYMLIDSGSPTSASYMSQTLPIPHDKADIAQCTAMAGELLGLKCIYLDAGSGARYTVSQTMVSAVRNVIDLPLIVGGGIKTAEKAMDLCRAGADIIVVGNVLETEPGLLAEIAGAISEVQTKGLY